MKTKTLVYEIQVPHYWDSNDIKGVPYDDKGEVIVNMTKDTDIWEYKGGLESMLNETLLFAEKKYNKRIDGEGNCFGDVYESKDLYIGQLSPDEIAIAQTNLVFGGEND